MNSEEDKFRKRFILGVTIVTLVTGWGGAALVLGCFPEYYIKAFPYIPLFFYLWELLFITLLHANRGGRVIRLFMGMKVAKLLLSILAIGIYTMAVGERNTEFVLTFMSFYLIYLIFETIAFGRYGKKLKNKGND